MLITVDTNVLYAGLRSKSGASHAILRSILTQELKIALSVPLFIEYEAVLKRSKSLQDFGMTIPMVDDFLDALVAVGYVYKIYYNFRPNLRDEADNMLVELSLTSHSQYLITNNIRDFTIDNQLKFDDLRVITPRDFWIFWRYGYEQI